MATGQPKSAPGRPCAPPREKTDEPGDALLLERFALRQDEAAFAALVHRYGPMVLAVCRRVLQDRDDAQDAFQVTFLVLARKAGCLARPELLGNWLYGVAYRTAVKAKARAARRRDHERRAAVMAVPEFFPADDGSELRVALDQELNRLPEKYRAPLVLCYLEGKTNEEAARLLGWPTGSMSGRLARGRELLRRRLTRRGLAVSALLLALWLSRQGARAASVPGGLAQSTVRAAVLFAAGTAPRQLLGAAGISAWAADLTEEMLRVLAPGRRRWTGLLLAALLALLALAFLAYQVWAGVMPPGAGRCHH